ncbi:MAG: hypothetical protein ABI806_14335 [Candidatus Solibacter sp.]
MDSWQTTSRDLWIVVLRHLWSALTILLVTTFGLLFWIFFIKEETFDTTAKILVRVGNEQTSPAIMRKSSVLITGDRVQDVNSEVDILQSTDLYDQLITALKLDRPLPPKPAPTKLLPSIKFRIKEVIRDFQQWKERTMISAGLKEALTPRQKALSQLKTAIVVAAERNSNILVVHLFVEQREYGAPILNKLLDLYETFRLRSYREGGTGPFFRGEADRSNAALKASEDELRAFEEKWNLSAIQKQKEVLLEQSANNQALMNNDSIELRDLTAKLDRAQRQASAADPDIAAIGSFTNNSFPEALLQRLADLQAERQKLRLTELDNGARIQNNREQFRNALQMVVANLQAMRSDRQASHDRRALIVTDLQQQVRNLQDKEGEWNALKRRVKMTEESYLDFRKRAEENTASSVMEEQKIGNISIIQHATEPTDATGLSKLRLLALGLLFSLIAATAWVGVADFFDASIYTSNDVQKYLGIAPLEVVPALKNRYRWGPWNSYQRSDAFRKTAWTLVNSLPGGKGVVHFTSAARGEGVTTAVGLTAEHLARAQNLRPLVIELDRKSPTYAKRFGLLSDRTIDSFGPGADAASCIYTERDVAFAALRGDELGSRIDPLRLADFLNAVRPNYDVVLLEGPPLSDADAVAIGALADGVVLVVASGETSFKILERARQEMTAKNVSILGTILNKQKRYIPSWV